MRKGDLAAAFVALLLLGGATCPPAPDGAERLGPALVRLSSAVEAAVAYHDLPPGAGDEAILADATKDDPSLLAPFEGYALRVRRLGTHAAVLVCDAEGRRALLEDAGCTARLDAQRAAASACEFTLDVASACAP